MTHPAPNGSARRPAARLAVGLAIAAAVLLPGQAALADAPAPTNYRSEVTDIRAVGGDAAPAGVTARVVGGDSFLEVSVDEGHEVVVQDYRGNPYVRVRTDGTVEENVRSEATYLNESRDGGARPPGFQPGEPEWRVVAEGGTWAWHDHRIHDMRATPTPALQRGEPQTWSVTIEVDGSPYEILGQYRLLDAPNLAVSLLPAVGALAVVVGTGVLLLRRVQTSDAVPPLLVAAVAATFVGWQQVQEIPAGAGSRPLEVALPMVALVAATLALLSHDRARRLIAVLVAAASLVGWVIGRFGVLTHAVLPTSVDPAVDRSITAATLGVALAAAAIGVWSGDLAVDRSQQGEGAERPMG